MFKLIGVLVALYTALAVLRGEVFAKHRAWGQTVRRDERPRYFWAVIGVYSLLALALFFVF
ncbi:hypothetical protein [Arenimonas daejeonensis]|uniref:hypothetical protein n=1 Tax=Arenimonas daejeonensis TaxID=370777 RepID=UPI0011BD64A7|nr:hypothetical protein [Arenimonas daejeonensis]